MDTWPTFSDLMTAYKQCRARKPPSHHQLRFEVRLGENLLDLHREIHRGIYHPSQSTRFIVTHPKPREIFAAHYRDRIIHHLIVGRIEPLWEPRFIHASFACRKGKGPHAALQYLRRQARRLSRGGHQPVFALQLDLASFFVTISRPILLDLLLKYPRTAILRRLIETTLTHDARKNVWTQSPPALLDLIPPDKSWLNKGPDQGIPIGNLTSQFSSNVYLDGIDQWITRSLKPGAYLRYMDDLTLLDSDPERLRAYIEPIDHWLRTQRAQALNPSKTSLTDLRKGINYLGYRLQQQEDLGGDLLLFAPPKKKWEFIQAARRLEKSGLATPRPLHPLGFPISSRKTQERLACLNSRLGFLAHAQTHHLRKATMQRLNLALANPDGLPLNEPEFFDVWKPLLIKKHYRSIRLR